MIAEQNGISNVTMKGIQTKIKGVSMLTRFVKE